MSTDAGLLGPLHVPAAHLLVVDRLRRIIALGEVLPGEQLPSERVMAEQFGVSRLTVREALGMLRGEGLIESRRGTRGGPVVLENRLSLRSRRRRLIEFAAEMRINHEYRQAVEPMAAQLAASRSAADDVAAMRSANDAIRGSTSVAEFRRADSAFHLAVASASANPRIRRAVEDARSEMFVAFDAQDFVVLQQASADAHETIVAAIESQDAGRAAALMTTHLIAAWAEIDAVLAERVADA